MSIFHAPPVADEPKDSQDEEKWHCNCVIQEAQERDDIGQDVEGRDSISEGAKERGESSPREAGLDQRRASRAHIVSDRSMIQGVSDSPEGPIRWSLHPPEAWSRLNSMTGKQDASLKGKLRMVQGSMSPGVAVWCPTLWGQTRAAPLATRVSRTEPIYHFSGPTWTSRLALWLDQIGADTRAVCRAALLTVRFDPWTAPSLDDVLVQLETPWLPSLLETGRLVMHLQPILWLENLTIVAFEALARSVGQGRLRSGGELVRAAQAHQMMDQFQHKAFHAALEQCLSQIQPGESLFLNIQPELLADPDAFEHRVIKPLLKLNADPTQVVFEMVETSQLPPLRDLMVTVDRLRAYGSLIAIDDLGSGCASFTCIQEIEPDVVKLDRSLLQLEEACPCGLLTSLTSAAHSVGALVVAEGIETEDQLELVQKAGVDMAQGWHIGRPAEGAIRTFGAGRFLG